MRKLRFSSDLPVSRAEAFAWHGRLGAMERMLPSWQPLEILARPLSLEIGQQAILDLKWGPIHQKWITKHTDYKKDEFFLDVQVKGPFKSWKHWHRFSDSSSQAAQCVVTDEIEYELPLGPVGEFLGSAQTEAQLRQLFLFRHRTLQNDLLHHSLSSTKPLKFLVTGTTGLVGSSLIPFLTAGGHEILKLVRQRPKSREEIQWDAIHPIDDLSKLEGVDIVVHLAGENVAGGRWSDNVKKRIVDSRIVSTRALVDTLGRLSKKPQAFICASAVGYYGDRKNEELTEESPAGSGFLPEVCMGWESEAQRAEAHSIRTIMLRSGIVLSSKGGALTKMIAPFKLGLGGVLGSGQQWMSWIHLDDLLYAILYCATHSSLSGPVNCVAPFSVTNREFSEILAHVFSRPLGPRVPGKVLKMIAGEIADALLLSSSKVNPQKLTHAGFPFCFTNLEQALRHQLGLVG